MNWLVVYGWIGIAVFSLMMLFRVIGFAFKKVEVFMPRGEGPLSDFSTLELTAVLFAVTLIAWPAALYVLFSGSWDRD